MKKLKLYIASSLNGKIARPDGSVDWLDSVPNPDKLNYGYADFIKTIDTTIMGFKTYDQIIKWGIEFPYPNQINYVFTRNQNRKDNQHVTFVNKNHIDFVKELKQQQGKDIWLIGGAQINTLLFNAQLIDEIQLFILPIIIPEGINIFEHLPKEQTLKLVNSQVYSSGAVQLVYHIR